MFHDSLQLFPFITLYIDDEVIDMQYRPLCSPKLKNSFLTRDHDKLTILASCLHLLSFLAPNPPKKWQVIYGWPCFEIIMACYSLSILLFIYCVARRMKVYSVQVCSWRSGVRFYNQGVLGCLKSTNTVLSENFRYSVGSCTPFALPVQSSLQESY